MNNIVGQIMAYEQGEMTNEEEVAFFAELIKSKLAWSLQGMYGRQAMNYIKAGIISETGEVL